MFPITKKGPRKKKKGGGGRVSVLRGKKKPEKRKKKGNPKLKGGGKSFDRVYECQMRKKKKREIHNWGGSTIVNFPKRKKEKGKF